MLLWKTKNKTKQTNKSTAIFHGLYSYRPQKWRQNVQNFAVKPLADISYERATWAFFLVLLACVLGDKAGLCVGNLFWGKKTIKHVSEDTFSDQSSNGKGRKTAIASPKVSWELKVIHAPINVKPAGGGGGVGHLTDLILPGKRILNLSSSDVGPTWGYLTADYDERDWDRTSTLHARDVRSGKIWKLQKPTRTSQRWVDFIALINLTV